jgi:hypothetical protein
MKIYTEFNNINQHLLNKHQFEQSWTVLFHIEAACVVACVSNHAQHPYNGKITPYEHKQRDRKMKKKQ